jgi:hypothetical protein
MTLGEVPLEAMCTNCGFVFGEHCSADDSCPTYHPWGKRGGKLHAGFNRASRFHNLNYYHQR